MSGARTVARGVAFHALPCLLAFALIAGAGVGSARADESAPPSAPPPSTTDLSARPDAAAGAGGGSDSLAATAAAHDTSSTKSPAAGTPPRTPPPAVRVENASASPAKKKGAPKARARSTAPDAKRHASAAAAKPGATGRSPALYDGFIEADRVDSELERTERLVGRAQKSIILSKNTRAMKLFTSALDFQSDSRDAYKVRQYARAERLTLAARDFADRASRMVGPPREDPDYVEHVLRRTDDALDRAKDVLKTGAGRDAWSQHEDLKQEQKDAWKVFKNGDVGSAYKETLGVREGVLALLRQLQDLPVPRETAEKAIGGAQAALEQASKELGPKPGVEAVRLVRLANDYMAKARQSFNHGSYRSALLQAKVVERHVEHAVDVGRPGT